MSFMGIRRARNPQIKQYLRNVAHFHFTNAFE
jgi:hypothetical protein